MLGTCQGPPLQLVTQEFPKYGINIITIIFSSSLSLFSEKLSSTCILFDFVPQCLKTRLFVLSVLDVFFIHSHIHIFRH